MAKAAISSEIPDVGELPRPNNNPFPLPHPFCVYF